MQKIEQLELRLSSIESSVASVASASSSKKTNEAPKPAAKPQKEEDDDDDGVDLFASDSEEENEAAAKVREERLAAYNAKKSKKPALIAKSNVILDVKPWDDETNMSVMEAEVRKIEADGLLWGAGNIHFILFSV